MMVIVAPYLIVLQYTARHTTDSALALGTQQAQRVPQAPKPVRVRRVVVVVDVVIYRG